MQQIIFHIDVNSAFLSWTALDQLLSNPDSVDLRTIPSIIGGDQKSRRGVVLAKSVPAKKYHIQTGEPIAQALKKCPQLIIASPDHTRYEYYSKQLRDLLLTYTPDIEPLSIDECFLDFTPISYRFTSYLEGAKTIQGHIHRSLGFTVNIGISSNKLLAKMASDFTKPNRIHTLFPDEIAQKMWSLPVSDLYMVGRSSANTLHKLGILTIGDLAHTDPELLTSHLKSHGKLIWEYANGYDNSRVLTKQAHLKGIGNSTTLPSDLTDEKEVKKVLFSLAETVSERLRSSGQTAGMISVEVRYYDFTNISHQKQLNIPTDTTNSLFKESYQLFLECWNGSPIRLLGIRTSKLISGSEPLQLTLFDTTQNSKQKKAEHTFDAIKTRFGDNAIMRGSHLLDKNETT